jgi:hypothetical protein
MPVQGLHAVDNADELLQIEILDRPVESLSAHAEGSRGEIYRIKRVGILKFSNRHIPHCSCVARLACLQGRFFRTGFAK